MSTVIILENLIKFVEINTERLAIGASTICKTASGETVRKYLPCANTTPEGEYVIKCEDCPFSSVEAAKETIAELEIITKKERVYSMLRGDKLEE
jgi:hypothetical protein